MKEEEEEEELTLPEQLQYDPQLEKNPHFDPKNEVKTVSKRRPGKGERQGDCRGRGTEKGVGRKEEMAEDSTRMKVKGMEGGREEIAEKEEDGWSNGEHVTGGGRRPVPGWRWGLKGVNCRRG